MVDKEREREERENGIMCVFIKCKISRYVVVFEIVSVISSPYNFKHDIYV